jgi:carboxypeptidase C (cathepsin A)
MLRRIFEYARSRHIVPYATHSLEQRPNVVAALHAQAKSEAWVECGARVQRELQGTKDPSSVTMLPRLLERIPVMLFAGDQDFICNYIGQENLIQALTWNGGTGLGVRTFFFLSTVNMIVFGRKLKPKLGLLATSPLERGSPRGI